MADKEPTRILEPVTTPQHYVPPSGRELRAQSVHRLQVGLFGLCGMLLLVGLANIIMQRAQQAETVDPATQQAIAVDELPQESASETLTEVGVMPDTAPDPEPDPEAGLIKEPDPQPVE